MAPRLPNTALQRSGAWRWYVVLMLVQPRTAELHCLANLFGLMRSIFEPAVYESLDRRLRSLSPSSQRHWGRMSPSQVVCHMGDQMRCALGELYAAPRRNPLRNAVLRLVVVHLLPWPKGKLPTSPEMLRTRPLDWNSDLASTAELLRRAAERGPDAPWGVHPVFGAISGREWGRLIFKHTDHHLRQFGV